jgi:hypothetical protein
MSAAQMIAHERDELPSPKTLSELFADTLEERQEFLKKNVPQHVAPVQLEPQAGAPGILREAAGTIAERGVQRDAAETGERSMARCVAAFNGLTGRDLTEKEGWFFMAVLKMARSMNGKTPRRDDFVDLAAYAALAGESVLPVPQPKTYAAEA